jgi:ABC-2 type transport system permease protein
MRVLLFVRKTLRDCSSPKLLLAFLVPYYGLIALLGSGLSTTAPDDLGSAPLFTQEQALIELYSQLSFVWLTAAPMVFVAVLAAIVVAGEAETGTYQLLLSKPVRRWEVLLGKFLGITVFGFLTTVSGLFVGAVVLYTETGASAAAISGSVGRLLPGNLVYALVVSTFVAAVGTMAAVLTASRLKTALVTCLLPVLFFAFIFVRLLPTGGVYEDYFLYLVDLNYHLGNLYVGVQSAVGTSFNPATQQSFALVSGVYDIEATWQDPFLDGIVGPVPLAGHVPVAVSVGLILVLAVALFGGALYRFERMDIG